MRALDHGHLAVLERIDPLAHGLGVGKGACRCTDYQHRYRDGFGRRRRSTHFDQIMQVDRTVDVLQIGSCRRVLFDEFLEFLAAGGNLFARLGIHCAQILILQATTEAQRVTQATKPFHDFEIRQFGAHLQRLRCQRFADERIKKHDAADTIGITRRKVHGHLCAQTVADDNGLCNVFGLQNRLDVAAPIFQTRLTARNACRVPSQVTAQNVKCLPETCPLDKFFPARAVACHAVQKNHRTGLFAGTRQNGIAQTRARTLKSFGSFTVKQSVSELFFFVNSTHRVSISESPSKALCHCAHIGTKNSLD